MNFFITTLWLIAIGNIVQVNTTNLIPLPQRNLYTKTDTQRVTIYLKNATLTNTYTDSAISVLNTMRKQHKYTTHYINATLAQAHTTKAKLYVNNYLKAIAELDTALKLYTTLKDYNHIATTHVSIGTQYLKIELYDKAMYYFNQALTLQTHTNPVDSSATMETYCNIGVCLASNNNYNQALTKILPAYQYFKIHNKQQLLFETGNLLAQVYIISGNTTKASNVLQQVEHCINTNTPTKDVFYFYVTLADLNDDNLPAALSYVNKANALAPKLNSTDARLLSLKYANLYKRLQQYKLATHYFSLYVKQTDSIFNTKNINATINYQTQYQTVAKENKILQLSKASAIQQLNLQQQQARNGLLLWCALVALIVILILAVLAYWLRTSIDKLNILNAQITSNTATLTQQASTISRYQSQMNPHFIFNAINSIQGLLLNKEYNTVYTQLDALGVLMRQTLHNSETEYIPLNQELNYLRNYIAFEQANASFNFTFDIDVSKELVSNDALIPPMLLQPFVENCIKHGGFDAITNPHIQLTIQLESPTIIAITVTDNGNGLTNNKQATHTSRALGIVQQRLNLCFKTNNLVYNNSLTIHSTTKGYSVIIKLPYLPQY